MSVGYAYGEGDRLRDRNDYAYSPWGGQAFIAAWRESRDAARRFLARPRTGAQGGAGVAGQDAPAPVLARFAALGQGWTRGRAIDPQVRARTFALVRRFELSRRVHRDYDDDWRPRDAQDHLDLEPYVAFAELMVRAWKVEPDLRLANALLKDVDTLVAMRAALPSHLRMRVAALIGDEAAVVEAIAAMARRQA